MRTNPFAPAALSLSLALSSCLSPVEPRAPAARLLSLEPAPLDALPRVVSLALRFDRPLRAPDPDAVFLVEGVGPAALASDARRGALTVAHASRRVEAQLALDTDDASVLRVYLRAPLAPSTALALATTVLLRSDEGALAGDDDGGPVLRALAVAPARRCPTLGRVVFPYPVALAPSTRTLLLAFDRPVYFTAARASLTTRTSRVAVTLSLGPACEAPGGGSLCALLGLAMPLEGAARYELSLEGARDDEGRDVQLDPTPLRALRDDEAHPVMGEAPGFSQVECAPGERARGPLCLADEGEVFTVRAATTHEGALVLRTSRGLYVSPAGRTHALSAPRAWAFAPAQLRTLALDGTPGPVFALDPLAPDEAPRELAPAPRIDEVFARPFSSTAQEFIELVNDGPDAVDLAGLALRVGALETPPFSEALEPLAPGARALVVGAAFDPRGGRSADGLDVPVAPQTRLLRLATTRITSTGLADRGAAVALVDREGRIRSVFPGDDVRLSPRSGTAVYRDDRHRAERDPLAWEHDRAGQSTPGEPSRARDP